MPGFYRQRWSVELDGFDEPVEVTTSARDSLHVVVPTVDGAPQFPLGIVLEIVHNALLRTEVEGIPRSLNKFLDLVIDANQLDDGDAETNGSGSLDPTPAAHSGA